MLAVEQRAEQREETFLREIKLRLWGDPDEGRNWAVVSTYELFGRPGSLLLAVLCQSRSEDGPMGVLIPVLYIQDISTGMSISMLVETRDKALGLSNVTNIMPNKTEDSGPSSYSCWFVAEVEKLSPNKKSSLIPKGIQDFIKARCLEWPAL